MVNNQFKSGGSEYVSECIRAAVEDGCRTAVVTGFWDITTPVRIPSDFCLVLENCHLRVARGVYSNIFVNENFNTELGRTLGGANTNITVKGRGFAILDGNEEYNGLSERTHSRNGLPAIWNNNILNFANVDGFSISDIQVRNQGWWALTFYSCRHGYIGNIDFCANDRRIDKDGNTVRGLIFDDYDSTLVKNADGIDLRCGCNDILIENITGFNEDDTVALTALAGAYEKQFCCAELPFDISNVTIRNIRAASFCSIVRLLNQGGTILHDILIDGIVDECEASPHLDHGCNAVKIGDLHPYCEHHSTEEETYNITVRNVYAAGVNALKLAGGMKNLAVYGIECKRGTKMLHDDRGLEQVENKSVYAAEKKL